MRLNQEGGSLDTRYSRQSEAAFTIVELLIVIVVIAILAAISIVAYTGIQTRARASAIVSDLQATEKALNAYKVTSGASDWWIDNDPLLTGAGNPTIQAIINAQPEFRNYLQNAPTQAGLGATSAWTYDNDGDTYSSCASPSTNGVNLLAGGSALNTALLQSIDDTLDDGNLACGKFRYLSPYLLYSID